MTIDTAVGPMKIYFQYRETGELSIPNLPGPATRAILEFTDETILPTYTPTEHHYWAEVRRHHKDSHSPAKARKLALEKLMYMVSNLIPNIFTKPLRKQIWEGVWAQMKKPGQKKLNGSH